jgi:hypothetical protein
LPAGTDYSKYEVALLEGIAKIKEKKCATLLISFGIDTADGKTTLGNFFVTHLKVIL